MTRLFLVLAVLALSAPVHAQTATATWVQLNTLSEAQGFPYVLKDGSGLPVALSPVTCRALGGVTQCSAPAALPGPGNHAYRVTTTAPSAAAPILISVQPGAPNGYTVKIAITPATKP